MFRLPTEAEALHAVDIVQEAIDARRKIDLVYVRYQYREDANGKKHRRWFRQEERPELGTAERYGDQPVLSAQPDKRTYEPVNIALTVRKYPVPWSVDWSYAPYADVIKWSPNGYIAGRVRLDHVIFRDGALRLTVSKNACTVRGTGLDPTITRGASPLDPTFTRR